MTDIVSSCATITFIFLICIGTLIPIVLPIFEHDGASATIMLDNSEVEFDRYMKNEKLILRIFGDILKESEIIC